ncbi:unnamed protein product [Angiostrongylus costaricensis]|uniref:Uncharacterized protein n=1 Tax=Angiostrongylus costaricensis TaxID=334426 RepID=A0A0R3PGA3_ANGCS|nr:unnamed protein product [Angiostrongylus costaricensis]
MLVAVIPVLLTVADGIFFGGGGGGDCCCGCGTPQPASCGCQYPVPAPCPACPQNYCPTPPVAYCPQVQPVYYPGCNAGSVGCPGEGGYAVSGAAKTVVGEPIYPAPPLPVGGGSYPAPRLLVGGESYPAPRLPFPDAFPSGAGTNGGNNGLPHSPGYTGPPIGGENLGISQEPVAPSHQSEEIPAGATSASNYAPPLDRLRSPQNNCEQPKVRYVVLRMKKEPGSGIEEVMEEAEEQPWKSNDTTGYVEIDKHYIVVATLTRTRSLTFASSNRKIIEYVIRSFMKIVQKVNHPPPVEATASPLEARQIIDEINRKEAKRDGMENDTRKYFNWKIHTSTSSVEMNGEILPAKSY